MTASHSSSLMLIEHAVAQDAGVVDEDVEAPEGVDRRVDEVLGALPVGDVVGVGDRLAARCLDLGDDVVRRALIGASALVRAAAVVDHDLGALGSEEQGMFAPEPTSGSGDDRHAADQGSHGREVNRSRAPPPTGPSLRRTPCRSPCRGGTARRDRRDRRRRWPKRTVPGCCRAGRRPADRRRSGTPAPGPGSGH